MIGDRTANNSDEMKFNHVSVSSQGCTKCGTAFKSVNTNVYGTNCAPCCQHGGGFRLDQQCRRG